MTMPRRGPNRLLQGLILVSLGIHALIFLHIAGIYRSKTLSFIEFAMHDTPPVRSIPRPRRRIKPPPQAEDVKRPDVAQRPVPSVKPLKLDPVDRNLPDSLMERIPVPKAPDTSGPRVTGWDPAQVAAASEFETAQTYLEMVKLRIERFKRYPRRARDRQVQGSVLVRFVITPDGGVRDVRVARSSGHGDLDEAACKAVEGAAPFPRPPARFFKGVVPLQLAIVFELI